jgi:hypothetical protein
MPEKEKRTWTGIQANFALFQGEIIADPAFNGEYAFLTLRTKVVQRDQNSQFTEVEQDIPLMIEPSGPVGVVKKHIKAGRKLMAWCHYKSWVAQGTTQHAFVVQKIDLGDKPYDGPQTGSTPPLPG